MFFNKKKQKQEENDKEILIPIIEGIILRLEVGDIASSQY